MENVLFLGTVGPSDIVSVVSYLYLLDCIVQYMNFFERSSVRERLLMKCYLAVRLQ